VKPLAEIPGLTGMRGLAALYVLVFHYLYSPNGLVPSWITWFSGEGWSGVVFFFVLSGYLLAMLYTTPTKKYFIRRVFRTFPLYYASLPLYIITGFIIFSPVYLIYAQNYFPQTFNVSPLWTLTLEELFYFVIFPLILVLGIRPRYLVLAGLMSATLWFFLPYTPYVNLQMPEYFICYAAGIFLAKNRDEISRRFSRAPSLAFPLIALFIITDLAVSIAFGSKDESPVEAVVYTAVYGLVIIFMQDSFLFANRVSHFLGKISYGLYILQIPILWIIAHPADVIILGPTMESLHLTIYESVPIAALATLAAATASYYLFESPLIALGRRLTPDRLEAPASASGC
jgi:peptidoglycan/LPS O-acetylase OafA/YrhL